jgi:hypothetical protein
MVDQLDWSHLRPFVTPADPDVAGASASRAPSTTSGAPRDLGPAQ